MNYYHRHLGDYARDTGKLTMTEHGAYNLLLDSYYVTEQGIPADEVYRVAKANTKPERAAVNFVLKKFFQLKSGVWVKDRCEEEIKEGMHRIEQARLNGKKGGRPHNPTGTQQEPTGLPAGIPSGIPDGVTLQSPVSILQSKEKESEAKNGLAENPENLRKLSAIVSSIAQDHRTKESRR